jgi:hypothetical protein
VDARLHNLLNPPNYVLTKQNYDALCAVCDKLLLLGQFAGNDFSNNGHHTIIPIRRNLLGQLFLDLSFQMSAVLEPVGESIERKDESESETEGDAD